MKQGHEENGEEVGESKRKTKVSTRKHSYMQICQYKMYTLFEESINVTTVSVFITAKAKTGSEYETKKKILQMECTCTYILCNRICVLSE